ncbi:MAG: lysylphosphatidylglycerol synthase transmembrane domain-containing protein [Planctomycetia bacterium]|nr:lysylphosphatidylglycerol synthase transmembrane domain-containing protein [Planctomycetia bacterium]
MSAPTQQDLSLNDVMPSTNDESSLEPSSTKTPKRSVKLVIKICKFLILVLVVLWLGWQLQKNWREIQTYHWNPRFHWLVASGLFYLTAYLASAIFWSLTLRWLGQKTSFYEGVKAFYYSQLGKYIPGKAMVVVIRTGIVSDKGARASVAVACVFYETLMMVGTGAFLAGILTFFYFHAQHVWALLALGVALCSLVPLYPPVFTRLLRILRVNANDPTFQDQLKALNCKSFLLGVALMSILWLFMGLSLWATLWGVGITPTPLNLTTIVRLVVTTALATTLGFAIPIAPGGLGIREAVLSTLLTTYLAMLLAMPANSDMALAPEALATIVSLCQRITQILSEIVCALSFFGVDQLRRLSRLDRA